MAVQAPTGPLPTTEIAAEADAVDRHARFPRTSVEALATGGWLGLGIP